MMSMTSGAPADASAGGGSSSSNSSSSGTKRRGLADPEYAAISDLLSSIGEVDDLSATAAAVGGPHPAGTKRPRRLGQSNSRSSVSSVGVGSGNPSVGSARRSSMRSEGVGAGNDSNAPAGAETIHDDDGDEDDQEDDEDNDDDDDPSGDNASDRSDKSLGGGGTGTAARHTKLTDLEQHVRNLERENLHLKQTLLLGKKGSLMIAGRGGGHENIQQLLSERTRIVQEMVDQLNAPCLSLGDAARVWHEDCRIGIGVREWDAFGRLETISLWNVIRSVFASIAVDIVELRPHLPDGEMILTKWRIQGEIASPAQLQTVCSSEDCPETMRVALKAIKSSDLTFTVTTYVIFHDSQIAEQHHCWDQVGVFKRLFGGEIPSAVQKILAIPDNWASEA